MEWISYTAITLISIIAMGMDLKDDRISNKWLLFGFFLALELRFAKATAWFSNIDGGIEIWKLGLSGVGNALRCCVVIFILLFPLFCIKGLGGGDIKLLCVLAMFLPGQEFNLVLGSFLIGGVLAVIKLIVDRWKGIHGNKKTIHFSIAIAMATFIICISNNGKFG